MADPQKLYSKSFVNIEDGGAEFTEGLILSHVKLSLAAMESVGDVDWSTFRLEIKPSDGSFDGSFGTEPRPGLLQVVATATATES